MCSTVFGVKANVRDNIHFVEDNIVLYPAGMYGHLAAIGPPCMLAASSIQETTLSSIF